MHSKWQIWDFFNSYPMNAWQEAQGLFILQTFDSQSLRIVKDSLHQQTNNKIFLHKVGEDLTRDFLETEFQGLSLFGPGESYIIHRPETIPAASIEYMVSDRFDPGERLMVLCFDSNPAMLKKIAKKPNTTHTEVEPPRFWETQKLLDFICFYFKIPLSFESKQYLLESLEGNFDVLYQAAQSIKISFPDVKEISLKDTQEIVSRERLDQFLLAQIFGKKKMVQFFEKILELNLEFDRMRFFFGFMQSHLVKIADISYLQGKARLSNYDKDIQSAAKIWKQDDLFKWIECFNQWEILAKRKDDSLHTHIKQSYLQSFDNK